MIHTKETAANLAINRFNNSYNKLHATLRSSANVLEIKAEVDNLSKLSEEAVKSISQWTGLIEDQETINHAKELKNNFTRVSAESR